MQPTSEHDVAAVDQPSGSSVFIDDVRFRYGAQPVIDGITTTIDSGMIIGIVGPSGCGKSTLLSLVAGLLAPQSGTIEVERVPGRHPLSMVFQKDTLLPWLTARDNVRLHARFIKGRRPGRTKFDDPWFDELFAMAGLDGVGDKYPYQLSGGMRRRLAFLVAVAADPAVLLLDEPFSSVDEPTRIGIHQDVNRIARQMGMTTILVTHDLAEAITLCDRILILSRAPAKIVATHEISFGRDRKMLELRETPEFLRYYARLWHDLSEQIARGDAAAKRAGL